MCDSSCLVCVILLIPCLGSFSVKIIFISCLSSVVFFLFLLFFISITPIVRWSIFIDILEIENMYIILCINMKLIHSTKKSFLSDNMYASDAVLWARQVHIQKVEDRQSVWVYSPVSGGVGFLSSCLSRCQRVGRFEMTMTLKATMGRGDEGRERQLISWGLSRFVDWRMN